MIARFLMIWELFAEYGIPMDFSKRGIIDKETSIEESKSAIAFSEEYRNTVENNPKVQLKSQLIRRLPHSFVNAIIKAKNRFQELIVICKTMVF